MNQARNHPGYFVTFEGPEGAGKTTVIREVHDWLKVEHGIKAVLTREPGGTNVGDRIREVVHDASIGEISVRAEVMLYQASRAQHCDELLQPALQEGLVVLCDRYTDSSIAYQGHGRAIGCQRLDEMNHYSTDGLTPDLTLLLNVDVQTGLARRSETGHLNRMDMQALSFHQKVAYAYQTLYHFDDQGRWELVDASQQISGVVADTKKIIEARLVSAGMIERILSLKER